MRWSIRRRAGDPKTTNVGNSNVDEKAVYSAERPERLRQNRERGCARIERRTRGDGKNIERNTKIQWRNLQGTEIQ
jgi:hypothetical protein